MKKNYIIYGSIILAIIIAVTLFNVIGQRVPQELSVLDGMVLEADNGELLEFEFTEGNMFSIYISDSNADPGQKITLGMGTTFPAFGDITSAKFVLWTEDYGMIVNSWDFESQLEVALGCSPFIGECVNYGTSQTLNSAVTFNAPTTSGEYIISYKIVGKRLYDTSTITLAQESTNFNVNTIDCPDDYDSTWTKLQSISHGDWYKRSINTYSSAPTCKLTTYEEYKTTCDSGYNIDGFSTSRYSTGTVYCEEDEPDPIKCYTCNDDYEIDSKYFDSGVCGSGYSVNRPPCEAPLEKCYGCDGEEQIIEYRESCTGDWSSSPQNCATEKTCYGCVDGLQDIKMTFDSCPDGYDLDPQECREEKTCYACVETELVTTTTFDDCPDGYSTEDPGSCLVPKTVCYICNGEVLESKMVDKTEPETCPVGYSLDELNCEETGLLAWLKDLFDFENNKQNAILATIVAVMLLVTIVAIIGNRNGGSNNDF